MMKNSEFDIDQNYTFEFSFSEKILYEQSYEHNYDRKTLLAFITLLAKQGEVFHCMAWLGRYHDGIRRHV